MSDTTPRWLKRLQQKLLKYGGPLVVSVGILPGFAIAAACVHDLVLRRAGGPESALLMLVGCELILFAFLAIATAETLHGPAAAFVRTLPGGPATQLHYLAPALFLQRLAMGLGLSCAALVYGFSVASGPLEALILVAFGVLGSLLAVDGALVLTLLFGRAFVWPALLLVPAGFFAMLLANSHGSPEIVSWWSERAAWVGMTQPMHWALAPVVQAGCAVPSFERLLVVAGLAGLMRLALLGLMRTMFQWPDRIQADVTRRTVSAVPSPRDVRPRVTPPLPGRLWIVARLASWHGDALVPRVIVIAVLGVCALWLEMVTQNPRNSPACAAASAYGISFITGLCALLALVRWRAVISASFQAAKLNRWSRSYPAWSLYPISAWALAGGQATLVFAILAFCGALLAPASLALYPGTRSAETAAWCAVALLGLPAVVGGMLMIDAVTRVGCTASSRALSPWKRFFNTVIIGVVLLGALIGACSYAPPLAACMFGLLGLASLGRLVLLASELDRVQGYDIIETPQAAAHARLQR